MAILTNNANCNIRTGKTGMVWPAIPAAHDANLLALQFQLEESQWWPAHLLLEHQLLQAKALLQHAFFTVPYYQKALLPVFNSAENINALDWQAWKRIPILERTDVQTYSSELISSQVPAGHLPVGAGMTSGSTGRPISLLRTKITSMMWDAFTLRSHDWYGRNLSAKRAAIKYFDAGIAAAPLGASELGWGSASDMFLPHGKVVALTVSASIAQQVAWLQKEQPDYLVTYPSNLAALITHCTQHNIKLPSLKEIATIGELLTEELREKCVREMALSIVDTYSAEEIGYIAMQCPHHKHGFPSYHVQSENVLLEVLNAQNEHCKVGEVGRVVITTLHNFAKPLIRYAIGDYAILGAPCACGRGLPVLTKIMGRQRNMFFMPNGQSFWPSMPRLPENLLHLVPLVRQYQYVQKTLDWIEVRVATETGTYPKQIEEALIASAHQEFGYPFKITFNYVNQIPRGKNYKYEEFISEL